MVKQIALSGNGILSKVFYQQKVRENEMLKPTGQVQMKFVKDFLKVAVLNCSWNLLL